MQAEPAIFEESVVLLSPEGSPIGTAEKSRVHNAHTPLHSAFSVFLFDGRGGMLVQQRAWEKVTWPGIWSNACCGHPLPGEGLRAAAERRLFQELGLRGIQLTLALPDFRYRAEYQGIVEHEVCPVFVALCEGDPRPNPREVAAVAWVSWSAFARACASSAKGAFDGFSPWSLMEGRQLASLKDIALLTGCAA